MTGAIGSGLNDMHHATSAFRIATDIERVCSHQNPAYRIDPRVKFHLCPHFFTPVYSSTVFDWIVVVTFDESVTCVYDAVVLMVRHALHEVSPIAMLPKSSVRITIFLILNLNFNRFVTYLHCKPFRCQFFFL